MMKKLINLLSIFFVLFVQKGNSQASLAAEDMIDDLTVTSGSGEKISYTVVRDAIQKSQWYYMPAQSRLYEIVTADHRTEPEFTLIKYQYVDPRNRNELLEGGVLQFAIVMSPDNTTLENLRAALRSKVNDPNLRLAALPLRSANVRLVTPKGEFLAQGTETAGIAPLLANQKMVFSIGLSKIGTDVYDALVNSNTGMGVAVDFSYNGLTPPAGFKIIVNWDESYKFFSKNEITRAKVAGMYNWLSGSLEYKKEKQQIVQELKMNRCISVEAVSGETVSDTMLFHYIDPILQKITTEMFDASAFKSRMDSMLVAEALEKDTTQRKDKEGGILNFFRISGGKSIAVKDIRLTKKVNDTISFNVKQLVERKSTAGGFVGLGRYSKEIKDKLAIAIVGTNWQSAYFVLPPISDDDDIGIKRISLDIRLMNKGKMYNSQVFNWTKEKKWTDRNGTERAVAAFPLLELAKEDPAMKNMNFELVATINAGNSTLPLTQTVPVGNGENNIALPLSMVDIIKVDPELLTFKSITPDSKLAYVTVNLNNGTQSVNKSIKPVIVNGAATPPHPFYWLLPKIPGGNPVAPNIVFTLTDGTKVNWKSNGRKLNEQGMSSEIILQDADYLQQ
jgi:hypothetical protein